MKTDWKKVARLAALTFAVAFVGVISVSATPTTLADWKTLALKAAAAAFVAEVVFWRLQLSTLLDAALTGGTVTTTTSTTTSVAADPITAPTVPDVKS